MSGGSRGPRAIATQIYDGEKWQQRRGDVAIPKTIFQTISRKEQILPEIYENIDRLKKTNPNWEYRLFFDEDRRIFIKRHYGDEFVRLYNSINDEYGNCRADLFRYLLMYECGGVYLDLKSTCTLPFDKITEDGDHFLISYWRNDLEKYSGFGKHPDFGVPRELQNWHIICSPKHPFLLSVISRVRTNIINYNPFFDGVGRIGSLKTTGPIAYSQAILPMLDSNMCRVVDAHALSIDFSIYDKLNEHHRLSKKHYSKLRSPIVERKALANILWSINQQLRIVNEKKWVKRERQKQAKSPLA
jgi:hypothetical protein